MAPDIARRVWAEPAPDALYRVGTGKVRPGLAVDGGAYRRRGNAVAFSGNLGVQQIMHRGAEFENVRLCENGSMVTLSGLVRAVKALMRCVLFGSHIGEVGRPIIRRIAIEMGALFPGWHRAKKRFCDQAMDRIGFLASRMDQTDELIARAGLRLCLSDGASYYGTNASEVGNFVEAFPVRHRLPNFASHAPRLAQVLILDNPSKCVDFQRPRL